MKFTVECPVCYGQATGQVGGLMFFLSHTCAAHLTTTLTFDADKHWRGLKPPWVYQVIDQINALEADVRNKESLPYFHGAGSAAKKPKFRTDPLVQVNWYQRQWGLEERVTNILHRRNLHPKQVLELTPTQLRTFRGLGTGLVAQIMRQRRNITPQQEVWLNSQEWWN